jgi:hypothetical protein
MRFRFPRFALGICSEGVDDNLTTNLASSETLVEIGNPGIIFPYHANIQNCDREIFVVLMMGEIRLRVAGIAQEVTTIPIAAATMTTKVAQPKYLSKGEFACLPITLVSQVKRMTSRIRGGASKPLMTADQKSIFYSVNTGEIQHEAQRHGHGQSPHRTRARFLASRPGSHATPLLPPLHKRMNPRGPARPTFPCRSGPE